MGSSVEEIVIGDLFPELKAPKIKDFGIHIDSLADDVASELKYAFRNYLTGTAINHASDEGRDVVCVDDINWAYRQLVPEKRD